MQATTRQNSGDDREAFERTSAAARASLADFINSLRPAFKSTGGPLPPSEVILPIRPDPLEGSASAMEIIRRAREKNA